MDGKVGSRNGLLSQIKAIEGISKRFPVTLERDIMSRLQEEDEASREFRARRIEFLMSEFGPERHMLFFGGELSSRLFEDAKKCYAEGAFVGCLLLCSTFITVTLAGFYRLSGSDDTADEGFSQLLGAALDDRYLTQKEFAVFNKVRRARNFYVHPPSLMSKRGLVHRVVKERGSLAVLAERDARLAIKAVFWMLRRPPFTMRELP